MARGSTVVTRLRDVKRAFGKSPLDA